MKRFLSILIALILVISMFSVTAVAFAEEPDDSEQGGAAAERTVTFNAEKFKQYVFDNRPFKIEMSEDFMFDGTIKVDEKEVVWYKDSAILHEIFDGINYIELKDEDIIDEDGDHSDEEITKFKVTYDMNLPEGVEGNGDEDEGEEDDTIVLSTAPADAEYQVTQYVTLANNPELEGYVFIGWEIEFSDRASEFVDYKFEGGFIFNMPEAEVTVKANWQEVEQDEEGNDIAVDVTFYANDSVYLLYCGPDGDPKDDMKNWSYCNTTSDFELKTEGWWCFRFAVVNGLAGTDAYSYDNVLATSYDNVTKAMEGGEKDDKVLSEKNYTIACYTEDTTAPVVDLSESMKDKSLEGLTAGTKYTVSTSLDVQDASTYTATFEVYKKVKGEWVLIFDSTKDSDERVTEGYEDCISVSGSTAVITPLDSDVSEDAVYKIIYTVKDAQGFGGVKLDGEVYSENHPELLLHVNAATKTPDQKAIEAWKIVLYVIAGLAAVGIVVLLFIKPKQKPVADARFNTSAQGSADGNDGASDNTDGKQE